MLTTGATAATALTEAAGEHAVRPGRVSLWPAAAGAEDDELLAGELCGAVVGDVAAVPPLEPQAVASRPRPKKAAGTAACLIRNFISRLQ
jgi:hypothetical protein